MALYVILSSLTEEGAKTLKEKPGRVKEVNEELAKMGVKVLDQYAVLGDFDFLNIVEAPDTQTMAKAAIELGSRGTLRTKTLPIIPLDEFLETL